MDSFDSVITLLQIVAAMLVATPLICYVVLRNAAAFSRLRTAPRVLLAIALGWLAVPLLLVGAFKLRDWTGGAWLHANCGVVPTLWVGVPKPIIAPLPRFLLVMERRDKAEIVNALTNSEPRWPAIDIDSPELELPRQYEVSMSGSEDSNPATNSAPLERSALVLLSHEQSSPLIYGALANIYTLTHGYGVKTLAIQRVPFGVRVLAASYLCRASASASSTGTNEAIIRMIRAVLRPDTPD